ncbi:MAG: MazG family protein [Actinomycetota bacterium]|nr:MazG family protein [Actinomycetota bacterium]
MASPRVVPTVVVVGLGPAGPELTTLEAREVLNDMGVVLLRTGRHPAAAPLVEEGARPLDAHYERAETFDEAYEGIVEEVVAAATEHGRVAYCVPGSPFVLERSVARLIEDERVAVRVVPGMSFLDLAWSRLLVDPVAERVRLVDAERFSADAAGDTGPMLVAHLWSRLVCSDVKLALETPPGEPVVLLHHLGLEDEVVREVAWDDLDRITEIDHLSAIYVRSLAAPVGAELVRLSELVRTLRDRCPWDREQTHDSLVRHLVEETYEVVEAIEDLGSREGPDAASHLEEELGDLLCQVMLHATLASEEGLFNLADVAREVHDKLVRRHPHVFGPGGSGDLRGSEELRASDVLGRWEQAKIEEKGRESLLEGIPSSLPALALAAKLESKVAGASLGWEVTGQGAGSLRTSLDSLATGDASVAGELLLGVARLAASLGSDPEEALRRAARSFATRLDRLERAARGEGRTLAQLPPEQVAARWEASRTD